MLAPEFAEMLLAVPTYERVGFVFDTSTQRGATRRVDTASRIICDIGEKAGVVVNRGKRAGDEHTKYASAHDLRRAFGTRWAQRIMPPDLQRLMRHKSIETTMKYYVTHDAKSLSERMRAAIGDSLGDTGQNPHNASKFDSPEVERTQEV